ncbi:MAG: Crp/Fnr family transcriptional regulator [Marinifilaceae bacterium]
MEKRDLLFFCSTCRNKSVDEIDKITCDIPHTVKQFKRGEHIAFQGDKVHHLMILTQGSVKTEIVSTSGLTLPMETISAASPLASAFLFADNNKLPVDIMALQDCEVIYISKQAVEQQIMKCPGFMRGFMAFNANRMQQLSERLTLFAQKSIKAKFIYYLLSHEKNGEFSLDRSVSALAEYFGVERPSLSRAISEMSKEQIITFNNGRGKILNYNALERLLR